MLCFFCGFTNFTKYNDTTSGSGNNNMTEPNGQAPRERDRCENCPAYIPVSKNITQIELMPSVVVVKKKEEKKEEGEEEEEGEEKEEKEKKEKKEKKQDGDPVVKDGFSLGRVGCVEVWLPSTTSHETGKGKGKGKGKCISTTPREGENGKCTNIQIEVHGVKIQLVLTEQAVMVSFAKSSSAPSEVVAIKKEIST